jgi:hypothetical protein
MDTQMVMGVAAAPAPALEDEAAERSVHEWNIAPRIGFRFRICRKWPRFPTTMKFSVERRALVSPIKWVLGNPLELQ